MNVFASIVASLLSRTLLLLSLVLLILAGGGANGLPRSIDITSFGGVTMGEEDNDNDDTDTDNDTASSPITPTAYTTGGGGFWTMTGSMGIIRAWYESNILEHNTTHFGGSSGGSWFQTQFSYSKEFYESAIGRTGESIPDFVSTWGTRYGQMMQQGIESQQFEESLQYTLATSSEKCLLDGIILPGGGGNETVADIITGALDSVLDKLDFPANNWYFYIGAMLGSYLPDANSTIFSTERHGFPKGTIIISSSFGPNIYQNDPLLNSPKLNGLPKDVTLLPISYVAPEGKLGGWDWTAAVAGGGEGSTPSLEISIKGNTTRIPITSLPIPSLLEVSSASSSFLGLTGSPILFQNTIRNFIQDHPTWNLTFIEQKAIQTAVNLCLPVGLQNTSSSTEGNRESSVSSWNPLYRYMDGGYTEGSSITHTIAAMQQSCSDEPSKYDCTRNGLRLLNIVGNNAQSATAGEQNGIPRLFANCNCGTSSYQSIGNSFDPQIFAEDFPTDLNDTSLWSLYSTKVYEFNNNTEPSRSYALRMTVTTVENVPFGVTGGMPVEIIIFFPDLPPQEKEIWPGYGANYAFSTMYAQTAQEQYASALGLFNSWNLSSEWGTGPRRSTLPPTAAPIITTTRPTLSPTITPKKTFKKKTFKKKYSKKNTPPPPPPQKST